MSGLNKMNFPAGHLYVRVVDACLQLPAEKDKKDKHKYKANSNSNCKNGKFDFDLTFDCEVLIYVGEGTAEEESKSSCNSTQVKTITIHRDSLKKENVTSFLLDDNDNHNKGDNDSASTHLCFSIDSLASEQHNANQKRRNNNYNHDAVLEISEYYGQLPVVFSVRYVKPKRFYSFRNQRIRRREKMNSKVVSTVGIAKVALANTLVDLRKAYLNKNKSNSTSASKGEKAKDMITPVLHKLQLNTGGWIKVQLQFCRAPSHIKRVEYNNSAVRLRSLGYSNDSELMNLYLTIQQAIEQDNALLTRVLISSLAKVNASLARRLLSNRTNHPRRMTMFELACERGSELVLRAVLQVGSDMIMREWMSNTTRSLDGLSDIHHAVIGGNIDTVETLCALKCEWIHRRRRARSLWSQFEHLESDVISEAETNVFIEGEDFVNNMDDKGNTPLMYAVQQKHNNSLKLVQTLINYSAEVSMCNHNNDTSLLLAVKSNNTEITKLLLNLRDNLPENTPVSKCKPNMPNLQNEYPLLVACKLGNLSIVEALLCNGALPNVTDGNGVNALHFAAQIGCMDIVQLLVEKVTKQCFSTNIYEHAKTEIGDDSKFNLKVLKQSTVAPPQNQRGTPVSRTSLILNNNMQSRNVLRDIFRVTKHRSRAVRSVSIDTISKTLTIPSRVFRQSGKNISGTEMSDFGSPHDNVCYGRRNQGNHCEPQSSFSRKYSYEQTIDICGKTWNTGQTALEFAFSHNHPEIADYLKLFCDDTEENQNEDIISHDKYIYSSSDEENECSYDYVFERATNAMS